MSLRSMTCALIGLLALPFAVGGHASTPGRRDPMQRVALDPVLTAYTSGDTDIIARTFAQPRDFVDKLRLDEPRELERWLGSWDRGKAQIILEIARAAARIAPRYTPVLVGAGRTYLHTAPAGELASPDSAAFVHLWHRIAVGLLEGTSDPWRIDEHLADLERKSGGPSMAARLDARLLLARAVTQERRCWDARPSLDQPARQTDALSKAAGAIVANDLDGPRKALREGKVALHAKCLREAQAQLETAAANDETRAEARVRAGWVLFQQGHVREAVASLDAAQPGDDRQLAYWRGLFRGRALAALDWPVDAAAAYRDAVTLYPAAQTAGIGLALALMQADRDAEADEVARVLRAAGGKAPDPWSTYLDGDQRFVDRWLDDLRRSGR